MCKIHIGDKLQSKREIKEIIVAVCGRLKKIDFELGEFHFEKISRP